MYHFVAVPCYCLIHAGMPLFGGKETQILSEVPLPEELLNSVLSFALWILWLS